MNSYEISKDMCPDYGPMCNKCNANGHCLIEYLAKSLIRKSYRKVADDEIVIKKRQYEQLKKYNRDRKRLRLRWQQAKQDLDDIYNNGFVLLVEHREIVDQVARETRQETAREVSDKIYNKLTESDMWHDMKKIWWRGGGECYELKCVLNQVLKELNIESEGKNNDDK